jgi:hypothetical protein
VIAKPKNRQNALALLRRFFLILSTIIIISPPLSPAYEMASIAGDRASQAAQITNHMQSMFCAILTKNGITNTDNVVLEQEMVMFFKLSKRHPHYHYIQTNHT